MQYHDPAAAATFAKENEGIAQGYMDNLCHTLVGAAIGGAGLNRRTRYARPTLLIAANLPDLDVLVFATGVPAVAFRRGWTHGALAQVALPLVLAGLVVLLARVRGRRRPAGEPHDEPPLDVPWLVGLAYLGVLSHVGLDYLNTYGVRLLSPLDWGWFYGDALFIIDVWLWAALGAGVWLTGRSGRPGPARGALVFTVCYVTLMLLSARASRDLVRETWRSTRGEAPRTLMVGPLPFTPFQREIIADSGDRYETGTFSWTPPAITFLPRVVPKNDDAPEVARARHAPAIRGFLIWSRFPYWDVETGSGATRVTVRDMRFGDRFSASTIVASEE
jgi:inner membrane protein